MAAADTAAAETWAGEDKRRMLHVVYRVGDMQVRRTFFDSAGSRLFLGL
jgi:hypothetical protein